MDQPAPHPYRDGLPPAPPGPPEGEQHPLLRATEVPFLTGLSHGPIPALALAVALLALGAPAGLALAGGLAATAAGAVLLGLGRYFAVLGAAERYAAERLREEEETQLYPERERWEVAAVLHRYGLRGDILARAVEAIAADRRRWVDFMMRFELDLIEPQPAHAGREAAVLALGALLGGALVLLPLALWPGLGWAAPALAAALVMAGAGFLLGRAEGQVPAGGAARSLALGAAAALAALALAGLAP
ncbi:MAG: VIT1/CCC1 transporter family protein [Roseococcus sp.]|jgi:VIT1/CCC1 family predicted Fe2+/Mn2+ transporter